MHRVQAEKDWGEGGMLNLICFGGFFVAVVWPTTSQVFSFEKEFSLKCQHYKHFFPPTNNIRHAIGKSQVCWKHNAKI